MGTNPEGFEDRPVPVRPLDEEQARLVGILRGAGDRPVSFEELRSRGIDNPAVLCYELEIAGLPIRHVERPQVGGAPAPVGVQLEEPWLTAADAVGQSRGMDAWLAWSAAALQRSRSAALAGSRALALSARRAGAWLAAHLGWLAIVASSWLAARAASLARSTGSWLGGRREAWRAAHPRSSYRPLEVPPVDQPTEAMQIGPEPGEAEALRPPTSGAYRERGARARDGPLAVAAAWLGSASVPGSRLAESLRKHVDSVIQRSGVRARGGDPNGRRRVEAWVLAAVLVALVVSGVAIALSSSSSGVPAKVAAGRHLRTPYSSARRPAGSRAVSASRRHRGSQESSAGASLAASVSGGANNRSGTGEDAKSATQLQAEGHRLLDEGRYGAAAADLRAAMAASGGSTAGCQRPTSEGCLTYAYALYDLGRALQLEHHPGAAVPLLSERLRIDNQRPTVRSELNTARRQLHHAQPAPASSNSSPEESDGHESHGPSSAPHGQPGKQEPRSGKEKAPEAPQSHPPGAPASGQSSGPETASGPTGGPSSGGEPPPNGGTAG